MELINQICGSLYEVYGAPKQPIKSYTNIDGTNVQIFNLINTKMKETKKLTDCPVCDGTGRNELAPCCGAGYNSDIMICHDCHEHLGEDDFTCEDCNGTGLVDATESYDDFQLHRTAEREGLISELINEDDLMQE
jgi:RecJ-like exonuclease